MNRWSILAVLFTARVGMALQFQALAAVLPFFVAGLGLSYGEAGTLIGLFMLPGVVLAIPTGWLAARFGDKAVVLAGILLMAAGAVAIASADGFALAAAGRLLCGVGGVFLGVLLTKMTTDWFAGREIATAMAFLVASWPVGLAAAMALFGWWAAAASWPVVLYATAAFSVLGLALVAALYRPSPGAGAAAPGPAAFRLGRRGLELSILAGGAWAALNVGGIVFVSFVPTFLIDRGTDPATAGPAASLMIWLCLPLILLGGRLADRIGRGDLVIAGGSLLTAAFMAALPLAPTPAAALAVLVAVGLLWAAPAGPIMALPQQALAPEERAAGFGVYFTVYYALMAALPPAAGRLVDLTGSTAAPLLAGAAIMAATAPFLALFRNRAGPHPRRGAGALSRPGR